MIASRVATPKWKEIIAKAIGKMGKYMMLERNWWDGMNQISMIVHGIM